jgi:diguanylate cyclase (GGDEF)-like protein
MLTVIEVSSTLGAILAITMATLLLRRRHSSPLATPLAMIMFGCAEWALFRTLSYLVSDPTLKVVFEYALYPGVALTVAGTFWYCLLLTGRGHGPGRRTALLLSIEPAVVMVVALTDPWHHLLYLTLPSPPTLVFGPLFWVHTAYGYLLITVGMGIVVRATLQAVAGHRKILIITLVSGVMPFAGDVVSVLWRPDGLYLDFTPVLFLMTSGIWLWVERYSTQTRLVPVSARQVLMALDDAVMVLDPQSRVLDLNPAALRLLSRSTADDGFARFIGRHWNDVVAADLVAVFDGSTQQTIRLASGSSYEIRVSPMDTDNGSLGSVVVVRDVTEVERLRADLAEQAVRDALTGLYNRRHFQVALAHAVEACAESGAPLSAVMIDVDHFKQVNDTYGHAAGDAVLVRLAQQLVVGIRADDVVARYGGEEFVLLLSGVTVNIAARRARELRERCARVRVRSAHGPICVTISAGVAQLPVGGTSDALLRIADDALYAAKAAGRNSVVVAGQTGEPSIR